LRDIKFVIPACPESFLRKDSRPPIPKAFGVGIAGLTAKGSIPLKENGGSFGVMMTRFDKITILGVGLIGASFALAARKAGLCGHISGTGRNEENLRKARGLGIIDSYDLDPASACADSGLILLATPVGTFRELLKKCSSALKIGALVTDAGSVKGSLVYEIEGLLPGHVRYIGAHPIAGSDRSGIEASSTELFRGAKCIVTPTERSDGEALKTVTDIWKALGADVVAMDPGTHDRIYGAVSHLPHIIAYMLVNTVSDMDAAYLEFGGQGFRDATRIASSSPEMWRDICLLNRDNLLEALSRFEKNLAMFGRYLRASDSVSIRKEFEKARKLRDSLGQG
jgi:prephenate dehydrogenase